MLGCYWRGVGPAVPFFSRRLLGQPWAMGARVGAVLWSTSPSLAPFVIFIPSFWGARAAIFFAQLEA